MNSLDKPLSKIQDAGRRRFLKTGGTAIAATVAGAAFSSQTPAEAQDKTALSAVLQSSMPTRNLGRTGFRTSIFGLGCQAAVEQPNNWDVALAIIHRCLELGVNYFDTAPIYGGPERWSEQYLGRGIQGVRDKVYVATKTRGRTRDAALRDLEVSLRLLKTDHIDCWKLHDVGTSADVDRIFAKGGAMEAFHQAREQKMTRHLGISGHFRPDALMECIRRYPFDVVLLGLSAADRHDYPFATELLPLALEKQMGIVGMKLMGRGRILSSWTPPPVEVQQRSWEGLGGIAHTPGTLAAKEAIDYVLTLPVSTAVIGCDSVAQVEDCARIAQTFTPLSERQMAEIAQKTTPIARQAMFYKYTPRSG